MFHVKQSADDLDRASQVAQDAARQAGLLIRARWDTPLDVTHKGEVDLVTEVDLAAEAIIVQIVRAAFPGDRIVAEEGGGQTVGAPVAPDAPARTWFIDPLDGTTNFSHGLPHFCVSIALCLDGVPAVGVVYEPIRDWMFHAIRGAGAWRDAARLRVSDCPALDAALLATGFPYDRRTNPQNNTAEFKRLLTASQGMRRAGSAALDLAYVAAGWLDGYWEDRLKAWDIAAGTLLVREAGGCVTGMLGAPLDLRAGHIAAATPLIHPALVAELRAVRLSDTRTG